MFVGAIVSAATAKSKEVKTVLAYIKHNINEVVTIKECLTGVYADHIIYRVPSIKLEVMGTFFDSIYSIEDNYYATGFTHSDAKFLYKKITKMVEAKEKARKAHSDSKAVERIMSTIKMKSDKDIHV